MSPSRVKEGAQRGSILAIGGAEDKVGDEAILRRFVKSCGGRNARIAVIPTASEARGTHRAVAGLRSWGSGSSPVGRVFNELPGTPGRPAGAAGRADTLATTNPVRTDDSVLRATVISPNSPAQ